MTISSTSKTQNILVYSGPTMADNVYCVSPFKSKYLFITIFLTSEVVFLGHYSVSPQMTSVIKIFVVL